MRAFIPDQLGYIHKLALVNKLNTIEATNSGSHAQISTFDQKRNFSVIFIFPNDDLLSWYSAASTTYGQYIQYDFKKQIYASCYSFAPHGSDVYQLYWNMSTSVDGVNWVLQDEHSNDHALNSGKETLFYFKNPGRFRYFKFTNKGINTYSAQYILYAKRFDIFSFQITEKQCTNKNKFVSSKSCILMVIFISK